MPFYTPDVIFITLCGNVALSQGSAGLSRDGLSCRRWRTGIPQPRRGIMIRPGLILFMHNSVRTVAGLLVLASFPGCETPEADVSVATAQLTALPGDEREPVITGDGQTLAFVSDHEGAPFIYLKDGSGSPIRLTGSGAREGSPSWAPDGSRITFSSLEDGYSRIWIASRESGDRRAVTPEGMTAFHPAWSPDGARIAFISDASGSYDVWVMSLAGGEPDPVTTHPDDEYWPRWSPDGDRLTFYSTWEGEMTDIWMVRRDGSELTRLTDDPAEDYRPTWSPDGAGIAFVSNRGGVSALWLASLDGQPPRPVPGAPGAPDFPSWTPDGKALLVASEPLSSLYLVPVSGGSGQRLETGRIGETAPSVSRDGSTMAFVARANRERNVWVWPMGEDARVLAPADEFQRDPAWSPDGQTIAYVQGTGGGPASAQLWVASADGDGPRPLTTLGFVSAPVWCGAETIVFAARPNPDADTEVWKVRVDGGTPVLLSAQTGHSRPSDCSQAGDEVLFSVSESGAYSLPSYGRLYKVSLSGGEPQAVETEFPSIGARWSPDGKSIALLSETGEGTEVRVIIQGVERRVPGTANMTMRSWPTWSADGQSILIAMASSGSDIQRVPLSEAGSGR